MGASRSGTKGRACDVLVRVARHGWPHRVDRGLCHMPVATPRDAVLDRLDLGYPSRGNADFCVDITRILFALGAS
jgi:hypothetical protein